MNELYVIKIKYKKIEKNYFLFLKVYDIIKLFKNEF